jgi:hypothetical protein
MQQSLLVVRDALFEQHDRDQVFCGAVILALIGLTLFYGQLTVCVLLV